MSNITIDSPVRPNDLDGAVGTHHLRVILDWVLRRLRWVVAMAAIGAVAGVAFGVVTPAQYTASSDILVDPAKLQVVSDDIYSQSAARESQLLDVESKMRIMTSGNVLSRVVTTMGLDSDPEFSRPQANLFGFGPVTPVDVRLLAQRRLGERIRVRREEKSFVVTMAVWSEDPNKSVAINAALYLAFKDELAQGESDGAASAADSLLARLEELRADVAAAEAEVEEFRRSHGLQSSSGELVATQSMGQLNTQLNEAQRRLVEAQSRYDELNSGLPADSSAQQSPTIALLRAQYATTKQQYDAQLITLGPRHPTMVSLATQVQSLQGEIDNEYQRLVAAARNDVEQAQGVVDDLGAKAADFRSDVNVDNVAMVEMRELERVAAAKAAIYESFLARSRQLSEREQVDTTNVRLISPAVPPQDRSWPPRLVTLLAGGLTLGALLGALLAISLGFLGDRSRVIASGRARA
jgi:polysaccharide biosynthesis transport protein